MKEVLLGFFEEKNVVPPITAKKLEKAGHNKTQFLLELRERLGRFSGQPIIKAYLNACDSLL